ncbi:MAG: hypothetical protein CVU84_11585 [Firmicutes bacterium HGW-Firmicutes-1]|jgi:phosphoglycerol transferase MdoB-like AlkP superfamily enzyme|nr:MAG: hypothetical protein CVU84_11585 [Firmicutes bacterium HGW-Firmicutes-1]
MSEKLKKIFANEKFKKFCVVIFFLTWVGSLTLKALYVQFSIKINKAPVLTLDNMTMGLTLMFTIAIIGGIVIIISGKRFKASLIALDLILTLVFLADMLYGRYYYNPITVPILKQIAFLDDVKESTSSLFQMRDLLMFADLIVLVLIGIYVKKLKRIKPFYVQMIVGISIILVSVIGIKIKYDHVDTTKFAYERKYIGRDLGLIYYHFYDVKTAIAKSIDAGKELTKEQVELIESVNVAGLRTDNPYTNIGEGKNVIVIQLEAFQNFLIDLEVDGQEVTPFLNSLKEKSIYMSNYFIETAGGNTVDAELLTNTSMLPTYGGSAYYEFPSNTYITLPNKLKEKGYSVNSYHGYEASFWNREVMHKTLGFDRFYSLDDFDMTEKVGWAISDRVFLQQSLDFALEASQEKPFYAFMATLSSHHPYDAFYSGPFTQKEGESQEMLRRYMNAGNYVDSALKEFFEYLKEKGVYEDTIVVIYGDHAGLFNDEAKMTCEYFGLEYNPYQWQKYEEIPLFIHIPGLLEPLTSDKACGQSDILPTLANIMGFDLEYTMSQDILDPNYMGSALRRNSNVITNEYVYIAQEETLYDFETGKVLDKSQYMDEINKYYDQLLAQDLIYKSDYFGKSKKE